MRAVVQRVLSASVWVNGSTISAIDKGLLVLLGIETEDSIEDADWLCAKLTRLRIFSDSEGLMNRSVVEIEGQFLVVSQFTLHASYKKGNRPSYIRSARPEQARNLYEYFLEHLWLASDRPVKSGEFGAMMEINMVNDGPVTIVMDSKNKE